MLEVYDSDYREADIVDIDAAFSKLILEADDNMNNLVKSIDGGTLIDSYTFFDRFGVKLYVSELSTGCKAAICVYCNPDKIVDLQECGLNARDAIFNYCENGMVLLHDFGVTIVDEKIRKTAISYAGHEYSISTFNEVVLWWVL